MAKKTDLNRLLGRKLTYNIDALPKDYEYDSYVKELHLYATVPGINEKDFSKNYNKIKSIGYLFQMQNSNSLCCIKFKDGLALFYVNFSYMKLVKKDREGLSLSGAYLKEEEIDEAIESFFALVKKEPIEVVRFLWTYPQLISFFSRERAALLKDLGIKSKKMKKEETQTLTSGRRDNSITEIIKIFD